MSQLENVFQTQAVVLIVEVYVERIEDEFLFEADPFMGNQTKCKRASTTYTFTGSGRGVEEYEGRVGGKG